VQSAIFEAAETLFKLATDTNADLASAACDKHLKPLVNKIYGAEAPTASTAGRAASSFGKWADAAHPFPHGSKTEAPINLPDDLAVFLINQGASHIRWLAAVDQQAHS
jgi:hypothetical protein